MVQGFKGSEVLRFKGSEVSTFAGLPPSQCYGAGTRRDRQGSMFGATPFGLQSSLFELRPDKPTPQARVKVSADEDDLTIVKTEIYLT
ncbi:MAG: hypothetical protein JRJ46_15180 [Deltaproteobacteria bacterium]|nr:hypothetical protein [Deltaproteobacteria bacterium]